MPTESEHTSVASPRAPRPGKKYFTVDEADRSLKYITRVVDDVVACYREAVAGQQRLRSPQPGDKVDELEHEYEQAMNRLSDCMAELEAVGVEVKDLDKGLVDFPAVHDEREIYLCWKRGEKSITTWHEVDSGFAGRQDVKLLNKPRVVATVK